MSCENVMNSVVKSWLTKLMPSIEETQKRMESRLLMLSVSVFLMFAVAALILPESTG